MVKGTRTEDEVARFVGVVCVWNGCARILEPMETASSKILLLSDPTCRDGRSHRHFVFSHNQSVFRRFFFFVQIGSPPCLVEKDQDVLFACGIHALNHVDTFQNTYT